MKLDDAYNVLGLEPGCSLEELKSKYKQAALKSHPDKNPDDPNATALFQRVGEAYQVLVKALDPSQEDSDEYEDDDDYYYDDDDEDLAFFLFMFEEMMAGRARRRHASHMFFRREQEEYRETPEEYAERLRRSRQAQVEAQERRNREAAARRAQAEMDRERERAAAEKRQKVKAETKKTQAQEQRSKAEATARAAQQQAQKKRSAVFAAARAGKGDQVKKGVWEDDVDAAGGEIRPGCQEFVKKMPNDPRETLLHIVARKGDKDLVEWLDAHSAEPEERDSRQFTAFHVALESGHVPVVAYFFETHDPKDDSSAIYEPPASKSLLSIAVDSHEPELVWMILDKGLATEQDINQTWAWATSTRGRSTMKNHPKAKDEVFADILKLLMRYGGFTPPPTPSAGDSDEWDEKGDAPRTPEQRAPPSSKSKQKGRGHGQGRGRGRA
ncbi:hypothetical protein MKEN_01212500 [Mycena kentingensis (nom. inval.)]|nr:hypothetical protein MKEN_01212500 [Mycena kentingensis (nom. inval.)]